MKMAERLKTIKDKLYEAYPMLQSCDCDIVGAFELLKQAYINDKVLYIAGNGGSAADSEHIVGELMKAFKIHRPADPSVSEYLRGQCGESGLELSEKLEGALRAISLPSMLCVSTAFMNDKDPAAVFAQQINALGRADDVFLAISTSGNSKNILLACMAAHARGMKVIGLTGATGGKMTDLCDITIKAPSQETYAIQEYHLPIYHALCAMLEEWFFGEE